MNSNTSALLTDLYMLTMLQGFFHEGMEAPATYEFFVRDLPPERGFLLAAGLEQVLQYLEALHFSEQEIAWLASTERFNQDFVDYLAKLRFTGDVYAMPEGTVFFPNEPILRVTAPIPQAQFIETRVINLLHFQTLLASKAARCVLVAPDKLLVDFGLRRAHGAEAGLFAARAAYLAGFGGTATVLAGKEYDIPIFGTMAHSFVQAHDSEPAAFEGFAHAQPDNVVLLIDTYDTEAGARKVVEVAPRLKAEGIVIKGVRLDSGNLAEHARKVRKILNEGGLSRTNILCCVSCWARVRRSTALASAHGWILRLTLPTLIAPTSWSSMRDIHDGSVRRVRRPGLVANRCIAATVRKANICKPTSLPLKATCNRANR